MNNQRKNITKIPEIILKGMNQEASPEELKILQDWLSQSQHNRELYEKLCQKDNLSLIDAEYRKIDSHAAWEKVLLQIGTPKKTFEKRFLHSVLKYAAIFILPVIIGSYLLFHNQVDNSSDTFKELEKQVSELKQSSLITSEGEILELKSQTEETVVAIDGTQIQQKDSTLHYNKVDKKNKEIIYNSLVTPKSKVFNLILADGTKVWLNASSAIKYPVNFTSDERKVFLTGEAYFEVTHDSSRPFIVSTDKMELEVLGTSFDVMAYPTEKTVETTLVTGKVNIRTENSNLLLEPGMQAQLDINTHRLEKKQVDTELITSWRYGKYIFEYENLESVMTKLSRWYNVEVSFTDKKKQNLHFTGTLNKYNDINETLHIIELTTDVKFKNSGNIISVN